MTDWQSLRDDLGKQGYVAALTPRAGHELVLLRILARLYGDA